MSDVLQRISGLRLISLGYIVVKTLAGFGGELLAAGDDMVPLLFRKTILYLLTRDTIFHQSIDEPGIEVVTGTDSAHRLGVDNGIALAEATISIEVDGAGTISIDELRAIEAHLIGIDFVRVVEFVDDLEVLTGATHDVSILQVLEIVGRDTHHLILVRRAEVDIVIDDSSMGTGIVEEPYNLWTDDGVDGVEGAKDDDVVRMDVRIDKVELVVGMILIEDVLGIVVFIEESQGDRRLRVGKDVDIISIDAIIFQKLDDVLPYPVTACLTDECRCHAGSGQRDDGIERRATGISSDRLLILKDYIENGLTDSYNFTHDVRNIKIPRAKI